MKIELNSGVNMYFNADDKNFLIKIVAVMENCFNDKNSSIFIDMKNSNIQYGNNNIFQQEINTTENINWNILGQEYSKIIGIEKNPKLKEAIQNKSASSFKNLLKKHIGNYSINVLSDLSSTAIIEILKMFIWDLLT